MNTILSSLHILEILAASFSIIYSILLIREKIAGWAFGIAASLLSMVLFFETKIYAQAMISIYYAAVGVYGWIYWVHAKKRNEHIHKWAARHHLLFILSFTLLSVLFAYLFRYFTDSASPFLDSFVTLFGLLASIKEARKILTSWVYWFVINLFSAWLYYTQDLHFYAALMILYALICIPGYISWLRIYRQHPVTSA